MQNKHYIGLILILFVTLNMYSQNKDVELSNIEDIEGLLYEKGSETPFTGRAVAHATMTDDIITKEYIKISTYIKNGIIDGIARTYYANDSINEEVPFVNGLISGHSCIRSRDGIVEYDIITVNGIVTYMASHYIPTETEIPEIIQTLELLKINPKSFDEITFSNGIADGCAKTFYPNGQIKIEVNFRNGIVNGEYKTYYENGQLHELFHFKDGLLLGPYKRFNEEGILVEENNYNKQSNL